MTERMNGEKTNRERMGERVADDKAVLSPRDYFRDVAREASHASSITLKAMHIEDNEAGAAAINIFKSAPPGARKRFILDWYTRLIPDGDEIEAIGRLKPGRKKSSALGYRMTDTKRKKYEFLIREFKQNGVELEFTNKPKGWREHVMPFVGRDHIKAAIIDFKDPVPSTGATDIGQPIRTPMGAPALATGHAAKNPVETSTLPTAHVATRHAATSNRKIAYFGGMNFDYSDSADFMVKFEGNPAQEISRALNDIHEGRITEDATRPLDEHSMLFVDAGKSGESAILKEAVDMIANAKTSVENTSLAFPDGPIAKALSGAAKKQPSVKTEVIVSSASVSKSFLGFGQIFELVRTKNKLMSTLRRNGASVIQNPKHVHAKLLIVDRGTSNQRAYFGTHNLSAAGVKAGTREWGIFTKDPTLIKNLAAFYDSCKSPTRSS